MIAWAIAHLERHLRREEPLVAIDLDVFSPDGHRAVRITLGH